MTTKKTVKKLVRQAIAEEFDPGDEDDPEEDDPEDDGYTINGRPDFFGKNIKGLQPDEKIQYFLYRKKQDGKESLITRLIPPCDAITVKELYGGGSFAVRAQDEKGRWRANKVFEIEGQPKNPETVQSSAVAVEHKDSMSSAIDLIKTVKESFFDSQNGAGGQVQAKMMEMMNVSMIGMMTSMMEMMRKNMEFAKEMQENKNGTGLMDVIKDSVEHVANVAQDYIAMKSPMVAKMRTMEARGSAPAPAPGSLPAPAPAQNSQEEIESMKYGIFCEILNHEQENGKNTKYIVEMVKRKYPEFIVGVKSIKFENVVEGLQSQGLKMIDRIFLQGVYDALQTETIG